MKKRRLIVFISLLLTAALLCSCGSQVPQGSTSSEDPGTDEGPVPVTITFWHSASDNAGAIMDELVEEFNSTNESGITVNAVYMGQYSDATKILQTMLSAENYAELPDIMQTDATGKVPYYTSGKAVTTDQALAMGLIDQAYISNFIPAALSNWKYGGVQLGVPFATSTTVTFYNRDLIDSFGWDHVPESLTDLASLYSATADTDGKWGIETIPNTPSLANWLGQLGSWLVDNQNGTAGNAGKLECIDNGALEEFLSVWKDLYASGALENANSSNDDFIAGNVAFLMTSSSHTASILSAVDDKFEVGVEGMLKVNDTCDPGASVSGSCLVLFDSGDEARINASAEFMKFLTSDEAQARYASGTGYIPGTESSAGSQTYKDFLAANPLFGAALDQLLATSDTMLSVTVGPSADFYYTIIDVCSKMLSDDLSVDSAVGMMDEQLTSLLNEYAKNNP